MAEVHGIAERRFIIYDGHRIALPGESIDLV